MSPRVRWWLPHVALATLALAGAVVNALLGHWPVVVMAVAIALLLLGNAYQVKNVYRDGWHDGFREGLILPVDSMSGRIPPSVTRATATGCASPEVWDPPPDWSVRHKAGKGAVDG